MSHKSSSTAFQYVFVASARDFQLNNGHAEITLFHIDKKLIKDLLCGLKSFEIVPQHDGLLHVSCQYGSGREPNVILLPHKAAKTAGLFSPNSYIASLSLWVTGPFGRKKLCERPATLRQDAKDPMKPMDANIPSAAGSICEQLNQSHMKSGDTNHEASLPPNQSQEFEVGVTEKKVKDDEYPFLKIGNTGPAIVSTNFWDSDIARAGKFIVSVNAGHLRLLVPDNMRPALDDMLTGADHVQISALPSDRWVEGQFCTQWLFEDFSESPYMLEFSPGNFAGLRPAWPNGDSRRVSFWIRRNGKPYCYAELPVRWSLTERLKDLRRTQDAVNQNAKTITTSLAHLTFNTADLYHCARSTINPEIINLLYPLLQQGKWCVPGFHDLQVEICKVSHGAQFNLIHQGHLVVSCYVAWESASSELIWTQAERFYHKSTEQLLSQGFPLPDSMMQAPVQPAMPWLAVVLYPHNLIAMPLQEIKMLGELEQCIAWTLIDEAESSNHSDMK